LLLVLFLVLRIEKPKYMTLEIPMPQTFPRYAEDYAMYEEFSTRVSNELFDGQSLHYYVYRMYVSVSLGEQGFETEQDVENYYDEWLKKLGWEEARTDLCNPYMTEFQPIESFRAYTHPDNFATACLTTWFHFGDEEYLDVMIKTINPSWDVLWYTD
jgi:hypothetical protein